MTDLWSPLPGARLYGYGDEVSVGPHERVAAMAALGNVAAGESRSVAVELLRLRHGDPNPDGPGLLAEPVEWGQPDSAELRPGRSRRGSYARVDELPAPAGSFTLALWYLPTLREARWEALAVRAAPPSFSFGLFLGGRGQLLAAVRGGAGEPATWCSGRQEVAEGRWQFAALAFDAEQGRLTVHQARRGPGEPVESASRAAFAGPVDAAPGPLLLAAAPHPGGDPARHTAHFNGKLSDPLLLEGALGAEQALALARERTAPAQLGRVLGHWDFAAEVASARIPDRSGAGRDARAVNAPARAVTGPSYDGAPAQRYPDDPSQYRAIHFHDDDLVCPDWPAAATAAVPADARSGIYSWRLSIPGDELYVPFVVRPARPAADVALLVPTLTWQAYRSNHEAFSATEDGVLDPAPCLYDLHRDGSIVYHVSRRTPTRSGDPRTASPDWGSHALASDLYVVDWLEHERIAYDAYADQDLDAGGAALLERYRCLILSSHPEYWTAAMLDALRAYLDGGGRVLYLGGNGLFWVTSLDAERPWVMEVRKARAGDHSAGVAAPGEYVHSTTLEDGGLWERRGLPPRALLGVDTAGAVFEPARGRWGYRRTAASRDPTVSFLFDGVRDDPFGAFGLNLGSAAGVEIDAEAPWPAGDGATVVLARATHAAFEPMSRPEIALPPRSDLALTTWPSGAAVLATGSIAWSGSLSHAGYDNDVARITGNALRRFLNAPRGEPVTG